MNVLAYNWRTTNNLGSLMKVFMSWSGQRSHAVAEVLAWWVRCVLQAARPWISSEDLDRGSLWFSEINNSLSDTSVGIVCLTDENKDRPWVLFEAGALAKGLSNSRVCTFLIDLVPTDITDPLAQFNHTRKSPDDMKKLARTLNAALGVNALDTNLLNDICDVYWDKFDEKFEHALKAFPPAQPKVARPESDVLGEILESVRGMNHRIRQLESGSERITSMSNERAIVREHRNIVNKSRVQDRLMSKYNMIVQDEILERILEKYQNSDIPLEVVIDDFINSAAADSPKSIGQERIAAALEAARRVTKKPR
jgi:hypothetical protein